MPRSEGIETLRASNGYFGPSCPERMPRSEGIETPDRPPIGPRGFWPGTNAPIRGD